MLLTNATISQSVGPISGGRGVRGTSASVLPILRGGGGRLSAGPSDVLHPSPRLTTALRFGSPQKRQFLGDLLMPDFPRDAWKVLVISSGDEHLAVYDTERALQEPRKRAYFVEATTTFEMASFGLEYGLDRRLQARVSDAAFRLAVGAARRAQWGVRLDLENRKALMLSTPTLYPAAHRFNEAGTPWNGAGGDMKARMRAAEAIIFAAHPGYTRQDLMLDMSEAAWQAAQDDTAWAAVRANTTQNAANLNDLALYLGYAPGSCRVADCNVTSNGTKQSLWGETAVLHLNVDTSSLDTEFGSDVFALMHRMSGGNAFPPYFEDRPTTDWYPYEDLALPVVHDYTVGAIFYDMLA